MSETRLTSLDKLKPGEKGTIERINTVSIPFKMRLLEMGLTKAMVLEVIRFAPMGDPIDILIRGYHLSLRRAEAEAIMLTIPSLERVG